MKEMNETFNDRYMCVCVDVHVCNHVLYIAEVGNKRTDLHQNKWA